MKEYSARFIREEHEEKQKALRELQEKRDNILNEFAGKMGAFKKAYDDSRAARRDLWGGVASDEDRYLFFSFLSFLFVSFSYSFQIVAGKSMRRLLRKSFPSNSSIFKEMKKKKIKKK